MVDSEIAKPRVPLEGCLMSRTRRSFTTECTVESARRVIDSGHTIAEVARELGTNEASLSARPSPAQSERIHLRPHECSPMS
ncbi:MULTISPECIES: transposase [unclassified Rhodococcus (in: high G+C Gram-positive bacteria)]|uniref:transposase n=2 Tax=unclassified Rhodococcus (in: high G+C Gram-positive bacteria) TaxID=192944 RepID=UPI00117A453F